MTSTFVTPIGEAVRKASERARELTEEYRKGTALVAAPEPPAPPAPPVPAPERKVDFKAVRFDDQGDVGVVYGFGASIGKDKENDEVERAALIGMAHDFAADKAKVFCANHDEGYPFAGALVENVVGRPVLKSGKILPPGEAIPADDAFVAMNVEKGLETHWFFGYRPTDPKVVDAARKGEIVGFSWAGHANKTESE